MKSCIPRKRLHWAASRRAFKSACNITNQILDPFTKEKPISHSGHCQSRSGTVVCKRKWKGPNCTSNSSRACWSAILPSISAFWKSSTTTSQRDSKSCYSIPKVQREVRRSKRVHYQQQTVNQMLTSYTKTTNYVVIYASRNGLQSATQSRCWLWTPML